MRVLIYIRVSTKNQEKKYSLEGQRTELTRYAEQQGWTIIAVHQDVESGGKLDKKGLNALLDDVEDGKADVVLVFDQDRLSRLDMIEWEFLKDVLRKNKVKIAEPGRIADLSDEDDEFMSDLYNLLAIREKRKIVRRMMNGKRQKLRKGQTYGKGPFEYVYDTEEKIFRVKDDWKWTIPLIDDLYLNKKYGTIRIANELNRVSPTPTGLPWNETLVYRRLISTAFHGVDTKTFANGESIAVPDVYEPLRTVDTYQRIQKEMERRKKTGRRSRSDARTNLFRQTHFTCGICGRKIAVENRGEHNYFALKHGRSVVRTPGQTCRININTNRVLGNAKLMLSDLLQGQELAKKYIPIGESGSEIKETEKTLRAIEKKLTAEELKKDRLLDLYLDGTYDKETLDRKQSGIKETISALSEQAEGMKAKLDLIRSQAWDYEMIYQYMEIAHNFQTELTEEEQMMMFGRLFPEATLYPDRVEFIGRIGSAPLQFTVPVEQDIYFRRRVGYKGGI